MSSEEPLPLYTQNPSDSSSVEIENESPPPSYLEPPISDVPIFFQKAPSNGWSIIFNTRYYRDGCIFVGKDSIFKYEYYRRNGIDDEIKQLHMQGIGIPLFKVEVDTKTSFDSKLVLFKVYTPKPHTSFNIETNYHNFCNVRKAKNAGFTSFIFNFTPHVYRRSEDFQVVLLSHSRIPIHDYVYNDKKYRWIDESVMPFFNNLNQVRYGFKHTKLLPDQESLCDNWNGRYENFFLKNKCFASFFFKSNNHSSIVKEEYYGTEPTEIFGQAASSFKLGKLGLAELRIDDTSNEYFDYITNTNSYATYDSISSLNQEALVKICIATIIKMEKDIIIDISRKQVIKGPVASSSKRK
ncbi:hypothetical protein KGF54_001813 [Candida jiufengensis]|uniref:uncharacterized protein n=1 Tax=Candida jiufengensis TaxID=497108 RepID=UPI0022241CCA|nr:uncharacterized protein KGF54_001813 [Candida jiufengensis]KAI5955252.1 hypothetical protein KGF54_001813 [Candida jiufengensis]